VLDLKQPPLLAHANPYARRCKQTYPGTEPGGTLDCSIGGEKYFEKKLWKKGRGPQTDNRTHFVENTAATGW